MGEGGSGGGACEHLSAAAPGLACGLPGGSARPLSPSALVGWACCSVLWEVGVHHSMCGHLWDEKWALAPCTHPGPFGEPLRRRTPGLTHLSVSLPLSLHPRDLCACLKVKFPPPPISTKQNTTPSERAPVSFRVTKPQPRLPGMGAGGDSARAVSVSLGRIANTTGPGSLNTYFPQFWRLHI